MSWLSDFLGTKKIRMPSIRKTEMAEDEYGYGTDAYLRRLMKKGGFEKTLITGAKKPKLGALTLLG